MGRIQSSKESQLIGEPFSLREIQQRLGEMLGLFDAFCSREGIRYYLAFGTLLGAVRHSGFIPWDDDVDVFVPRPDYERLIEYNAVASDISVVSRMNNHGLYHPYTYCNLVDGNTILVEHHARKQTGKGLFIDVFPLDGMPEDGMEARRYLNRMVRLSHLADYINQIPPRGLAPKDVAKRAVMAVARGAAEALLDKVDAMGRAFPFSEDGLCSQPLACVYGPDRSMWESSMYCGAETRLAFEGMELCVPNDYKGVLESIYGNYMQLPPVEKRTGHHGFDTYPRESKGRPTKTIKASSIGSYHEETEALT